MKKVVNNKILSDKVSGKWVKCGRREQKWGNGSVVGGEICR
jgi:hypothetical protein